MELVTYFAQHTTRLHKTDEAIGTFTHRFQAPEAEDMETFRPAGALCTKSNRDEAEFRLFEYDAITGEPILYQDITMLRVYPDAYLVTEMVTRVVRVVGFSHAEALQAYHNGDTLPQSETVETFTINIL